MRIERAIETNKGFIEERNKMKKQELVNLIIRIMDNIRKEDYVTLNMLSHYEKFSNEIIIDMVRVGVKISISITKSDYGMNLYFSKGDEINSQKIFISFEDEMYKELNNSCIKLSLISESKIADYASINMIEKMLDDFFKDYTI